MKITRKALVNISDGENNSRTRAQLVRLDMEKKFIQTVVLLLLNFILLGCPLFAFESMIRLNISCEGCLFPADVHDELYCVALFLFLSHDINGALFYLLLIPKYRQSFLATLMAAKEKLICSI